MMTQKQFDEGLVQWLTFTVSWMVAATFLLLTIRLPLGHSSQAISAFDALQFLLFGTALLSAFPVGRALGIALEKQAETKPRSAVVTVLVAEAWVCIMLAAGRGMPWLVTSVGLILLATGLSTLWSQRSQWRDKGLATMAVAGVAMALFHQLVLVRKGYSHPWAFELALAGLQHRDTLFHAAIAGSILSHGVPSIGIDGNPLIHYHTGSHFLIGHLGAWTNLIPLQAYSAFMPIVGVPLLFGMLLCAGEAAASSLSPTCAQSAWSRQLVLLAAALLSIRMDMGSLLKSESYAVSLTCMLAGIYLTHSTRGTTRVWNLVACLLIATLVAATSASKISTGAVMACGIAVWLSFGSGRPTVRSIAVGAIFALLPFLVVYAAIWAGQAGTGIGNSPFALLLSYPKEIIFDLVFGGTIIVVAWRRYAGDRKMWPLLAGMGAMVLAASGAAMLLDLPGSTGFYFLNVGLMAVLSMLPLLAPFRDRLHRLNPARERVMLLAIVLGLMFVNGIVWKVPHKLVVTATRLSDDTKGGITDGLLHRSPYGRIFTRIEGTPGIDGVFVDPGYDAFWKGDRICWAASLIIPALTGVPMLMGYPPPQQDCDVTKLYGFGDYSAAHSAPIPNATRGQLCMAAKDRDMVRILRVSSKGTQDIIDCRPDGVPTRD
jgi:hypothetical protein